MSKCAHEISRRTPATGVVFLVSRTPDVRRMNFILSTGDDQEIEHNYLNKIVSFFAVYVYQVVGILLNTFLLVKSNGPLHLMPDCFALCTHAQTNLAAKNSEG